MLPDFLALPGVDPALLAAGLGLILALPVSLLGAWVWSSLRAGPEQALTPQAIEQMARDRREPDIGQQVNQSFDRLVERTGLEITSPAAIGLMLLSGLGFALVATLVQEDWIYSPVGFFVGIIAALVCLAALQSRWRESIRRELPDALHLAARAVRAGLNLDQTIGVLGAQAPSALSREFGLVARRMSLGVPMEQALRLSALKVRVPDFDLLAAGLALHRRVGGDVSALLVRLATSARERHLARGQFRASTALGRTSAVFLALGGPILLLLNRSSQPESFARFVESSAGQSALGVAIALEVIGLVWIALILRHED
jgi:tight adherence protein B